MKMKLINTLLVGLALTATSLTSNAGLITVSDLTPTIDGADIAMLNAIGQSDPGGNEGHIWSNRPAQGQSFTTGSNFAGYWLNSITLQNEENSFGANNAKFTLRIGSILGTTFSAFSTETNSNSGLAYVPNDYITFTFANSILLNSNSLYGFEWDSNSKGFTTWANHNSNYSGGEAFSSYNGSNLIFRDVDRIFHADLTAVPEPSTLAIFALGMIGLASRRFKKQS